MDTFNFWIILVRALLFAIGFAVFFLGLKIFKFYIKIFGALIMGTIMGIITYFSFDTSPQSLLYYMSAGNIIGWVIGWLVAWPLHKFILYINGFILGFAVFAIAAFAVEPGFVVYGGLFGGLLTVVLIHFFHEYFVIIIMAITGAGFCVVAGLPEIFHIIAKERNILNGISDLLSKNIVRIVQMYFYYTLFSIWFQKWINSSFPQKQLIRNEVKKISLLFSGIALLNLFVINIFSNSFMVNNIRLGAHNIGGITYLSFTYLSIVLTYILLFSAKNRFILEKICPNKYLKYLYILSILIIVLPIMYSIFTLPNIINYVQIVKSEAPKYYNQPDETNYFLIGFYQFISILLSGLHEFYIRFSELKHLPYLLFKITQISLLFVGFPIAIKQIFNKILSMK